MKTVPRVHKGDKIRASTHNAIVDCVEDLYSLLPSSHGLSNAKSAGLPCFTMAAYNGGVDTLAAYDVAVIRGQVVTQAQQSRSAVLRVARAESGDNTSAVCVVLDSIPVGGMGRVVVMGICWAKYDVTTSGNSGSLVVGSSQLTLSNSGVVSVIQAYLSYGIAICKLGGGGSSSSGASTAYKGITTAYVTDPITGATTYSVQVLAWDEVTVLGTYSALSTFPPIPFAIPNGTKVWIMLDPLNPAGGGILP